MNPLLQFSYDRKNPFKDSCDQLKHHIDSFAEGDGLKEWYAYFERAYSLPPQIVTQALKRYLEGQYVYHRKGFSKYCFFSRILVGIVRYFGLFVSSFLYSQKYSKSDIEHYDLMVEWIEAKKELDRVRKLAKIFGNEKTIVIAVHPFEDEFPNLVYRPAHKYYDRKEVFRALKAELKRGFILNLKLSWRLQVNMFAFSISMISQFLYYQSLFKRYRAKYCIQERHFQTSSIKNFLFRKSGGVCSTAIQKNIYQMGRNGFYHDADIMFSLGTLTANKAFEYGANIGEVLPIGSIGAEYYWFIKGDKDCIEEKKWDISYMGINGYTAMRYLDVYDTYREDYYKIFQWLVDLSRKFPELKIGVKHHPAHLSDPTEVDILKGSNVVRIDNRLNSYKIAFQSKLVVSNGSTMGYEVIAHGTPCLFLDPGKRSTLLQSFDEDYLANIRMTNYGDFKETVKKYFFDKDQALNISVEPEVLCLKSDRVSERIYEYLTERK